MTDELRKEVVKIASCLNPLKGIRETSGRSDGKIVILDRGSLHEYLSAAKVADLKGTDYAYLQERYHNGIADIIDIPCGRCLNCRLNYARKWSERCMLESKCWEHNWFITLTYDDDHLPIVLHQDTGEVIASTLVPPDVVGFFKRLREYYDRVYNHKGIRFFLAGEYGDRTYRAHYHICAFNLPISDLVYWSRSPLGDCYYNSATLSTLWQHGHVVVGELTAQSAAYTARYCTKKINGNVDYDALGIHKEYVNMSRKPGIGVPYLLDHWQEIYADDTIYLPGGRTAKPPRIFDDKAAKLFGVDIRSLKIDRIDLARRALNLTVNEVGREYYSYLDDLEQDLIKRSKVLDRSKI